MKASGRFKDCMIDGESDGAQLVKFDIPLSTGVVCSTFATKYKNQARPMLIPGGLHIELGNGAFSEWYKENGHCDVVIMGVECESNCAELKDWANEVEAQGDSSRRPS